MIHAIQYLHGSNWLPAAVTAHSIRKNGGLCAPRLTLYTTDRDVLENPYLARVFDEIREPPAGWRQVWETDWNRWELHSSHVGQRAYPIQFRRYAMVKYYCFLATPCEAGETLLYTDTDMLCMADISPLEHIFATDTGPAWAARVNYWKSNGEIGHINAGMFARNAAFSEVAERFLEPVLDPEIFAEAMLLSLLDDEAALKWTLRKYGPSGLHPLGESWNLFVGQYTARPLLTVPKLAHWCFPQKPWLGEYPSGVRSLYLAWEETAREVCELMGYPVDGSGVSDLFKWPHRLGEWKPKEKDKPLRWRTFA